jgi:hypothetical protein
MKDLFLNSPAIDLEKTSEQHSVFLPADSGKWVKEIIGVFLQKFPFLQNESVSLT